MIISKRSRQVLLISLFAMGLLTLISCKNKPKKEQHNFRFKNTSNMQLGEVGIFFETNKINTGTLGAGRTSTMSFMTAVITEKATVEWVTPDGKKHSKDIGVIQGPISLKLEEIVIELVGKDVKVSVKKR